MALEEQMPHFVLFPLMAPGHMNPMMDIAKILVHRNVIVTVVTTPHNAARFSSIFDRYVEFGFQIRLVQLQFPCIEGGVPDGCENLDMIPSLGMAASFFNATRLLQQPSEKLCEELIPPPSCIISDMCLPYTSHIAEKLNIPRISFVGVSCFCLLCNHNIRICNATESLTSDSEYFVLPGIPDKIETTIAQAGLKLNEKFKDIHSEVLAAEMTSYGIVMNSFEELEPAYARDYKKVRGEKAWCIGPVSLINSDHLDKAQRGRGSIDVSHSQHINWLDCQKPGSVIYACLGSLCNLTAPQLMELGLALEISERPFIWVIREGIHSEALEKWIKEYGFEERTNGRRLLIRGWAPQLLILSHPAIGGFITHCGWNSTLEAICAGVPMVTWPLFADQFLNESLVVHVLRVGVKVGTKSPVTWGEEEKIGVLVKKEDVERAIAELMDETSESEERRKRIREFADKAKRAVERGGSSHSNVNLLIQDIMQKDGIKEYQYKWYCCITNVDEWRDAESAGSYRRNEGPRKYKSRIKKNPLVLESSKNGKAEGDTHDLENPNQKEKSADGLGSNASLPRAGGMRENTSFDGIDLHSPKLSGQGNRRPPVTRKFQYHPMGDLGVEVEPFGNKHVNVTNSQPMPHQPFGGLNGQGRSYPGKSRYGHSDGNYHEINKDASKSSDNNASKGILPGRMSKRVTSLDRSVGNYVSQTTASPRVPETEYSDGSVVHPQQNQRFFSQGFGLQLAPPTQRLPMASSHGSSETDHHSTPRV
ncbi:hypothetical protein Fmac_006414 [Flemingia macrophylla]|uniref:Glycosyltransferase n=1 Tax=Flemingia macrophylla TaxID=520843 RepID=A0ABD1NAH6_9FABA